MRTVSGRMMAISGELEAVLDDEDDEYIKKLSMSTTTNGVTYKNKTIIPLNLQKKFTQRVFKESHDKNNKDEVLERMKCDAYDKAVSPDILYLSETKKFMHDNESFDSMVKAFSCIYIIDFLCCCRGRQLIGSSSSSKANCRNMPRKLKDWEKSLLKLVQEESKYK